MIINKDWKECISNIEDSSVDLVVTDPPYGMEYSSNYRKIKHKDIINDNNVEWLGGWVREMKRVCKEDSHLYVFCSWHNVDVFKVELSRLFNVKNILIWEKNNTGMGDLKGDFAPKYEMILFCSNGNKKLNGKRDSNIIKTPRTNNELHPTQKPVDLIRFLIEKSSKKGDLVLDTFAGSFSTAKAAISCGRKYMCIEIDKDYCDKAKIDLEGQTLSLF